MAGRSGCGECRQPGCDLDRVGCHWLGKDLRRSGRVRPTLDCERSVLVFEELGRASCPAPLLGAFAANLALAAHPRTQPKLSWRMFIAAMRRSPSRSAASTAMRPLVVSWFATKACTGRCRSSRGATATHHLIFIDAPGGVAVVTADAPGVTVRATPGLAVPPLCELAFANTPALCLGLPSKSLADIALGARLACAAALSAQPGGGSTWRSSMPR